MKKNFGFKNVNSVFREDKDIYYEKIDVSSPLWMRTRKVGFYLGSQYEVEPETYKYVKRRKSNWINDLKLRRI